MGLISEEAAKSMRCLVCLPSKETTEIGGIIKAKHSANLGDGQLRMCQKSLGFQREPLTDEGTCRLPCGLTRCIGEVTRGDIEKGCVLFNPPHL